MKEGRDEGLDLLGTVFGGDDDGDIGEVHLGKG